MRDNLSRNDLCPCGSGRKFKKCCQGKAPAALAGQSAAGPRLIAKPGQSSQALAATASRHWDAGRHAAAIAAFRDIAQMTPDSADAHYNLGLALFRSGQLAEAAVALQRAVERRPRFEPALQVLANVHDHMGRENEAAAVYRTLSRTTKDRTEQRLALAKALSLEGAAEDAVEELRRAAAAAPAHAGTHVLLGQLLLEKGAFAEAEAHLIKAIDDFPDSFQHVAASRRMTEADRPLLARLAARLEKGNLQTRERGAIHFGLGKAHDDLRDYAEAMRHYDLGNKLCGLSGRLDRAGLKAVYDELIATYSAEALRRARSAKEALPDADGDLPVLIIGMPRSGTTLTEQILSAHPDVAGGGELSFWSDRVKAWMAAARSNVAAPGQPSAGLEAFTQLRASRPGLSVTETVSLANLHRRAAPPRHVSDADLDQAGADYLALLRQIGPGARRVIDKAPYNFERLGQIASALPGARIIYCSREPVDNCLSIYFTNFKGRQGWTRDDVLFQYRQHQRLMDHWRKVLPRDRFTEVDYATLITDREAETRRLIAFLGLDWDDACLAPERNERVVRSASLWQARQGAYTGSLNRWRNYEPWLGEFRDLLPAQAD